MQRNYYNCIQKHYKKTFDYLVTGDETRVFYFDPPPIKKSSPPPQM